MLKKCCSSFTQVMVVFTKNCFLLIDKMHFFKDFKTQKLRTLKGFSLFSFHGLNICKNNIFHYTLNEHHL